MKITIFSFAMIALTSMTNAESAWEVIVSEEGCALESKAYDVFDGYEQTTVKLKVSASEILVATKSTVDPSYQQTGIKVDQFDRENFDTVVAENNVQFSTTYAKLLDQFQRGKVADLAIGYWPTWPHVELQHVPIDLIGFTHAFNQYQNCDIPQE